MSKKKSKSSRLHGRKPNGQFRKGVSGNVLCRPKPAVEALKETSLNEMILEILSMKKLAKSYLTSAYHGDPRALEQVAKIVEQGKQAELLKTEPDYARNLTTPRLALLETLVMQGKGIYVSDLVLLERTKALLQELAPESQAEEESSSEEAIEEEYIDDNDGELVGPEADSLIDHLQLGSSDPDRLENREYQRKLEESREWEKLYGPSDPDSIPVLRKHIEVN